MNKRQRNLIKVSQRQLEHLRIIYAIQSAIKYHNLKPKHIFEEGLNSEWISVFDVLRNRTSHTLLSDYQKKKLKESGKTAIGHFKIRKTKKGYIIYMDLARLKEVSKE